MAKYTIGVDFGSLSARAVLAETETGREICDAAMDYPHGVMDSVLAASGAPLPQGYALQDPADYLLVLGHVLPALFEKSGVDPAEVAGIGVDFTCCTLLPVRGDGTPLCFEDAYRTNPHAYVKLWKHHAAQKYADRINALARERGETWLARFGGSVSSEWMFPKIAEVLNEAPEIYENAAFFIEAGDWINWMLTGRQTRSYVFAAYKSLYLKNEEYPSEEFFAALDPRMRHVVAEKLDAPVLGAGECAGVVSAEAAARFGLAPGTVVAIALPDAHAAAPALDIRRPGDLFAVLGTSGCFLMLGDRDVQVPGTCGTVEDGILPGFYGYEAGLCCLGDHFAYAAQNLTSPDYVREAEARGVSMLRLLLDKAAAKAPGESGVLALNWFNGNRSILVNSELSGLFVGMTLSTRPEDLLRALLEATAFGARNIIENFEAYGVPVRRIVASGGIARKDPFTMQLYADILGRDIAIAGTAQGPALGMAISAAVAAGVYPDYPAAIHAMSHLSDTVYRPDPAHRAVYDRLYAAYLSLHDYFGRGGSTVMAQLRQISEEAKKAKEDRR